jgi:hypothetical protein
VAKVDDDGVGEAKVDGVAARDEESGDEGVEGRG